MEIFEKISKRRKSKDRTLFILDSKEEERPIARTEPRWEKSAAKEKKKSFTKRLNTLPTKKAQGNGF